jgi:beta-aspartyl-peptidase (threonine type)
MSRSLLRLAACAGLFVSLCLPSVVHSQAASAPNFVMVIHGGAGAILRSSMTPEMEKAYMDTLTIALRTGYQILSRGGTSLDAVEATIRVMEDCPLFNAGKGAVFTAEGTNELDASIMDGRTLNAGAVAALQHVKNPISLARLVMEKSPHVMIVGAGAEEFAKSQGVKLVPPHYFWTERRWEGYEAEKARADICARVRYSGVSLQQAADDVVMKELMAQNGGGGVIAMDRKGNIATPFNTPGMYRAWVTSDGKITVKIYKD